jgi:hypothetical protein
MLPISSWATATPSPAAVAELEFSTERIPLVENISSTAERDSARSSCDSTAIISIGKA